METWYKTSNWSGKRIIPVRVVRETNKQVVVLETRFNGKEVESRNAKNGVHDNYFKTYKEAYDFIYKIYERDIETIQSRLEKAKVSFNKFVKEYKS